MLYYRFRMIIKLEGVKEMKVHIFNNAQEIGAAAGRLLIEQVQKKPESVLGLATGSSPIPTYQYLAKEYAAGNVSFRKVTTFNLDEYCDLPREDQNSYYSFMFENLFRHTDIDPARVNFLNGNAADEQAECAQYEARIRAAGGIDLQLLGIGNNGHIGFNEPAEEFTHATYKVALTESTLEANKRFFPDSDMPRYALTMGIDSILQAKRILLIATGEAKAQAVRDMIKGELSPKCPASVLQKHADVHIFLDRDAAKLL